MPAAEVVLLPLCIGLSLIGVVVALIAFSRGRRGRALQGIALALVPVALYLTGLLRLVWDAVVAIVRWATDNAFGLRSWIGFGLLALCVLLWIVGGVLARRRRRATKAPGRPTQQEQVTSGNAVPGKAVKGNAVKGRAAAGQSAAAPVQQDDDMAEIEALLKSRGIQ